MKNLSKTKGLGFVLAGLAFMIASIFSIDSFANGVIHMTEVAYQSLTLDTLKDFIPSLKASGSVSMAMAGLAVLTDGKEKFEVKPKEEVEKLDDTAKELYYETLMDFQSKNIEYLQSQMTKENEATKAEMAKQVSELVMAHNSIAMEQLKQMGLTIEKLKKEAGSTRDENLTPLEAEVKGKIENLKKVWKGQEDAEVEIKALTNRAAISNNENAYDLPDLGQLAHRKLSMYDLFPKIRLKAGSHNGTVRYYDWDEATTVRAAAAVAESGTYPQSTVKWKRYVIDLKKIGDTLAVTEEFFEDEVMFANELGFFLNTNVNLVIDDEICNGDGTNLTGLFQSSTAFDASLVGKADNATLYDLLVLAQEQVSKTGGSKYNLDFAVMNIKTINKMRVEKDENNNYVIPPFVSRDGKNVAGMNVIESNVVPDNALVIGDRRFAKIYEMPGMVITKGLVSDQFIEDEATLKIRKRILFIIKNADKSGFVKVTDIDAAITAITQA